MHFGAEDGHHGFVLGQLEAAAGPEAGALGVGFAELALGEQVAGVVAGVETKVWGPPIGTDGAYRVFDKVGALAPGGEAGGPLKQLQGLDDAAEAFGYADLRLRRKWARPEMAVSVQGGKKAAKAKRP